MPGIGLEAEKEIAGIRWFHTIDLGNGLITSGDDPSPGKLKTLALPASLEGKTFLDIGAWDGFFSFEAERRGAARVLATDSYVWQGKVPGHSKAGFLLARRLLSSKVEDREIDALDISPATVGLWDVVLLAGVLYHVRHPWLLIQRAASVTRELLIVETEVDLSFTRRPAIALFAPGQLGGDKTSFCAPNVAAMKMILAESGFSSVQLMNRTSIPRRLRSAAGRLVKCGANPWISFQQCRATVHARR